MKYFLKLLTSIAQKPPNKAVTSKYAMCCGQPLSEWFVIPAQGMQCFRCRRVWPIISHEEYRETQAEKKEQG